MLHFYASTHYMLWFCDKVWHKGATVALCYKYSTSFGCALPLLLTFTDSSLDRTPAQLTSSIPAQLSATTLLSTAAALATLTDPEKDIQ